MRAAPALKSLCTVLCGAAALLTAAAVLDPAALQARSITQPTSQQPPGIGRTPPTPAPQHQPQHAQQPAPAPTAAHKLSPVQSQLTPGYDLSDSPINTHRSSPSPSPGTE
jgi:hypothetical protein